MYRRFARQIVSLLLMAAIVSALESLTPMPLSAGDRLGHYEILAAIGAGGMGEVHRAKDSRLGREVALKVLPERLVQAPDALRRFEREARMLASLSHPNIVVLHDIGAEPNLSGGSPCAYAVMELLEGHTLRERLSGSGLNWRQAVEIAASVAEGLSAAHGKGITHRDLKPANIFLTVDGRVKILDFGLARLEPAAVSPSRLRKKGSGRPKIAQIGFCLNVESTTCER